MVVIGEPPPGGGKSEPPPEGRIINSGDSSAKQTLYSEKLKVNVVNSERLKRKVLEIQLVTDEGVGPNMELTTVAKLFNKLGIDRTSIMGYQLSGYKIYVWFKEHCDLDKFCYQDSIKVSDGIKTGVIKRMGKREVE